jgi:hypothetical protein
MSMMTPALRRFTFTTHITSSMGWVGAALAFLALAVIGFTSDAPLKVRGAYLLMAPAAWFVLVPLAHASLLSGIVLSLGSTWACSGTTGCAEVEHNGLRDRNSADLYGNVPADGECRSRSSDGFSRRPKCIADRSRDTSLDPVARGNSARRLQAVRDDRLWKTEARRAAVCFCYQLCKCENRGSPGRWWYPGLDLRGWRCRDWSGAASCHLAPDRPESDALLAPHRHRSHHRSRRFRRVCSMTAALPPRVSSKCARFP